MDDDVAAALLLSCVPVASTSLDSPGAMITTADSESVLVGVGVDVDELDDDSDIVAVDDDESVMDDVGEALESTERECVDVADGLSDPVAEGDGAGVEVDDAVVEDVSVRVLDNDGDSDEDKDTDGVVPTTAFDLRM